MFSSNRGIIGASSQHVDHATTVCDEQQAQQEQIMSIALSDEVLQGDENNGAASVAEQDMEIEVINLRQR